MTGAHTYDGINVLQKRDRCSDYFVKCSAVNLLHNDIPAGPVYGSDKSHSMDDYFEQIIHSSNPLIRVTVSTLISHSPW